MNMDSKLTKGDLVRCTEGNTHWVGEVMNDGSEILRVRALRDRQRYDVPRPQALSYAVFLRQQKRPQKLKTIYSEFFGTVYRRIPRERLKELHKALRKHGIDFDDSKTRADDFVRLAPNRAFVQPSRRKRQGATSSLPESIAVWLPKWLESEPLPPSSRDPLGLQAQAREFADRMLPGLTTFTYRVGYFFFLAWAVREINGRPGLAAAERREILNRLERALVLCEALHHGLERLGDCLHQGQRSKRHLLVTASRNVEIPAAILRNQQNTGCYNLYRTPMRSCGFWTDDEEFAAQGLLPFRLTARGAKLADAFERRAGARELLEWGLVDGPSRRGKDRVQSWGKELCFQTYHSGLSEKKWFLEGFFSPRGDAPRQVVDDSETRLGTVRLLAESGLMEFPTTEGVPQLVSAEEADGDVRDLPIADGGNNFTVLLHFWRNRDLPNSHLFTEAAAYELLSLAANAIFAALSHCVKHRGRLPVDEWMKQLADASDDPTAWLSEVGALTAGTTQTAAELAEAVFRWNGFLSEAALGDISPVPESALAGAILTAVLLAGKVVSNPENRELLVGADLRVLFESMLASQPSAKLTDIVAALLYRLVDRHLDVSRRKAKQPWIEADGRELRAGDPHEMVLGFHSYRFPQLASLARDLQLAKEDIPNA